ncbi:MAG: FadR family transcriptional regulator [Geminicoccaceae bacterium]|nr:FadR family transcriptional regulator [Geminicoccaceae bacterium]
MLEAPEDTIRPPSGQKLGDWMYERLLDRITQGFYAPQARLPSEIDLADEFGVSRPIVRKALARLRSDGLVVSQQGAGSYVQRGPVDVPERFSPLSSVSDIERWYEFRRHIEGEAAALAAERLTVETRAALDHTWAEFAARVDQGQSAIEEDLAFHMAIARASDNRFFAECLGLLREQMLHALSLARGFGRNLGETNLEHSQEAHARIRAAICAGDAGAARAAMRDHVDETRKRVFEGPRGA